MIDTEKPIGLFDSGVGGVSIWAEISALLPNENTIYLSDSKNVPYGEKSKEQIIDLCEKNTEILLDKNCKIIVVACNTATTNAIKFLREKYSVPFVGIEPAIKPAALNTKTRTIGILATKGTLNSKLFSETSSKIDADITVIEHVGHGLVKLIEADKLHSNQMRQLLQKHLKPMIDNKVDCLVLGCTHYTFLIPQIKQIMGNDVSIIDSKTAVARQTHSILKKNQLLNTNVALKTHKFFTNENVQILELFLKNYKNLEVRFLDF